MDGGRLMAKLDDLLNQGSLAALQRLSEKRLADPTITPEDDKFLHDLIALEQVALQQIPLQEKVDRMNAIMATMLGKSH
jgi:hypothetical protein